MNETAMNLYSTRSISIFYVLPVIHFRRTAISKDRIVNNKINLLISNIILGFSTTSSYSDDLYSKLPEALTGYKFMINIVPERYVASA